jgi:hypothetical protein
MREIRLSGSEGGAAEFNPPFLPLSLRVWTERGSISTLLASECRWTIHRRWLLILDEYRMR